MMIATVAARLRYGVLPSERLPAFDGRSRYAYALLLGMAASASLLMLWTGLRLDRAVLVALPLWPLFVIPAGMLARKVGHVRIGSSLELVALAYCQGLIGAWLCYSLTPVSGPLADNWLSAADHALGFDWTAFAKVPHWDLTLAYSSFMVQPAVVLLVLISKDDLDRAWAFVTAAILALAVTAVVYSFAPAVGPYWYYHLNASAPNAGALRFGSVIEQLKAGELLITPKMFVGLVSFPSYHAAGAVIFTWSLWPSRWLRWPALVLNGLMAYSAIRFGGHYLCDVLAGALVGALAVTASWRLVSR